MYFRHNVDDTIEINGVKFDYETFLSVEPDYVKPTGMSWRYYEQGATHQIHTIDGSQTSGEYPWEDGDRYISRLGDFKVMQKEEETDVKLVSDKKEKSASADGGADIISHKDKAEAMWDYLVMNQPRETTIDPIIAKLNKDMESTQPKNEYEDLL